MLCNPDPHNLAQEVLFSRKKKVLILSAISLNNIQVEKGSYKKHIGLFLDEKLTFKHHINNALCKANKGLAVIKKACFTAKIFTAYLQSISDAANRLEDSIFYQPHNYSFCEMLSSALYKAT